MCGESGTLGLLVVLRAIRVLESDLENAYLERMEAEIALKIIILIIMITEKARSAPTVLVQVGTS